MPKIGDAQTSKFLISPAEVRVGALTSALKLLPSQSVGLLNSATVTFNVESVDLEGGLPRVLHDTAITAQPGAISMDMREYSSRNIKMLLGGAIEAYETELATTVGVGGVATAGTTIPVADETGFAAGDLIGVYPVATEDVANITYAEVASTAAGEITVTADSAMLFDYAENDIVFAARPVAIGNITSTNYFSTSVLGLNRVGQPIGFHAWKCALSSGLDMAYSSDDFGTTSGELKLLQPSAADYATGGPLEHVATLIAKYPVGVYVGGGDVSA